jgi:hypothetical protein
MDVPPRGRRMQRVLERGAHGRDLRLECGGGWSRCLGGLSVRGRRAVNG